MKKIYPTLRENGEYMLNLTIKYTTGIEELTYAVMKTREYNKWLGGEKHKKLTPDAITEYLKYLYKTDSGIHGCGRWDNTEPGEYEKCRKLADKIFPTIGVKEKVEARQ